MFDNRKTSMSSSVSWVFSLSQRDLTDIKKAVTLQPKQREYLHIIGGIPCITKHSITATSLDSMAFGLLPSWQLSLKT
ncbi:hypothetical protein [Bacillus sp. XT-2]|uniref:hypothetical protein n=1 Tax=Bacillus sp. XT-2 TaxID=2856852 RepID=UPI0021E10155|nr:hypothetical protein [Bacillus sp. XT-2]MCV0022849.1 hypothetical protein [Bacillus sp. XT-2]